MAFFDNKETKTTMKIDNSEYASLFQNTQTKKRYIDSDHKRKDTNFSFKISVSIFLQSQNWKAKGKKNQNKD